MRKGLKKKNLKKVLKIVTCIVLLVCIGTGSAITKAAGLKEEDAFQKGSDVYTAWYNLNYSNYDYMIHKYQSPYITIIEDRQKSLLYQELLRNYRKSTFNLSSEVEFANKEIGYYECLLYDLICDENTKTIFSSFISESTEDMEGIHSIAKKIEASSCKELAKLGVEVASTTKADLMEDGEFFWKSIQACNSLEKVAGKISNITKIIGYCKDGLDLIDKLSQLEAILDASDEMKQIFSDMNKDTSTLVNPAFAKALDHYSDYLGENMDEETITKLMTSKTVARDGAKEITEQIWSAVKKSAGVYGIAVSGGQAGGKILTNTLFNTSDSIAAYYKLEAVCELEKTLKKNVESYERSFTSNPTPKNARIFNESIKTLYKVYLEGLDIYKDFVDKTDREGLLNQWFVGMPDEDYEHFKQTLKSLETHIKLCLDYDESYAIECYGDLLIEENKPLVNSIDYPEQLTDTTKEEYDTFKNIVVQDADEFYLEISNDYALTQDQTVYGSVNLKNGKLDLNGHKLTVYGGLNQTGGTLLKNGGTLQVSGNYLQDEGKVTIDNGTFTVGGDYIQKGGSVTVSGGTLDIAGDYQIGYINSSGDYAEISSTFFTLKDKGKIKVGKDFNSYGVWLDSASAGTMEIGGNWIHGKRWNGSYFGTTSEEFKMIFKGNRDLEIRNKETSEIRAGNVSIENAKDRKITVEGGVNFGTLNGGDMDIISDNAKLKIGTTTGKLHIANAAGLSIYNNCTGDITVTGKMEVVDDIMLSGYNLTVSESTTHTGGTLKTGNGSVSIGGDYTQTNGGVTIDKGTMTVHGSHVQKGGSVTVSGGTLDIAGDYQIGYINSSGDYAEISSTFFTLKDKGKIKVGKDFNSYGVWLDSASAGTMEIGGNWIHGKRWNGSYFGTTSEEFKMIFKGNRDLEIRNKETSEIRAGNVSIENAKDRKITVEGGVSFGTLNGDVDIISDNAKLKIGTTTGNLNINGDAGLSIYNSCGGDVTVSGNVSNLGDVIANEQDITINGDLTLSNSGTINLQSGTLLVNENLYQSNATIVPNNGTLSVEKNYYIANGKSVNALTSSNGTLKMTSAKDMVEVKGDFVMYSSNSHSSYLTAGTMKVAGNFKQISGSNYNFDASGTHEVILNGTKKQTVSFDNDKSHFNKLVLTQSRDNYEFTPDKCWVTLENSTDPGDTGETDEDEKTTVTKVTISPSSAVVEAGDEQKFTAKVYGTNNPSQDIVWSVKDNRSAKTTIDQNGTLTVGKDEIADKIKVVATSVVDNKKYAQAEISVISGVNTPTVDKVIVILQNASEKKFSAIVTGTNSPDQKVTWSLKGNTSSKTTISNNGILTIAKEETAEHITIIATSVVDNTKKGTLEYHIVKDSSNDNSGDNNQTGSNTSTTKPTTTDTSKPVKVSKISISAKSKKVAAGKKMTLTATVSPNNATNKKLSWKSSNTSYATVDQKGVVTTKSNAAGKSVTITATAQDGSGIKSTYNLSIYGISKITLSGISKKIATGKKITLTPTISPSDVSNKKLKWTSSNTKVATVDQKGVVTIKKKTGGKSVTITATAQDGSKKKATYKISVMKGVVQKIAISGNKSVKAGKALTLKAKVTASKGANKTLKWTSSNTKYAKVNSAGKVTTLKAGKGKSVKITAMATDGSGKKTSVTVKIK
ncbi:MAG: Ig-like domain-containing protein [Lachnospiraceae bacterium]|nr:Ig-like domain-containing protein [Lachnospiraceae bacterium]